MYIYKTTDTICSLYSLVFLLPKFRSISGVYSAQKKL